jgi:hypothetical protein
MLSLLLSLIQLGSSERLPAFLGCSENFFVVKGFTYSGLCTDLAYWDTSTGGQCSLSK